MIAGASVFVAAAVLGTAAFAQAPPAHPHLDFFLHVLGHQASAAVGGAPAPVSQAKFEQVLRILPPTGVEHGSGPALSSPSPGGAAPPQDPSVYGFCYEACRTDRAVGSCGKPAPGEAGPPQRLCDPIEDTATLRAIIGPPLGTGASPFVDDNKGPDGAQPAGYTFFGQFIDHDVTRTTTALSAVGALDEAAQSDPAVRTTLAAAGITPALLRQAVADAAVPGSALSANTAKLDLDSVYGAANFAALTGIGAPWFEQQNGVYTGRFAMHEVAAPSAGGAARVIDGFDYERTAAGAAEIPDPRNSEHKMLSQLQNLFELAHNDCVERALAGSAAPSQPQVGAAFDDCHRKVVWTYETIVATDFLPRISAEAALERVAPGALHAYVRGAAPTATLPTPAGIRTFLYSCTPGLGDDAVIRIPHEFAVAAFRLGHSLVRDDYLLHDLVRDSDGNVLTGQPRPIFASAGQAETVGLVGDNPLQPGDVIDWSYFFDFGGATAQATRPLDTLISDKLFSLPVAALPPGPASDGKDTPSERNLARRNLLRASEPNSVLTGSVGLATGEEAERYAQRRIPGLHDSTAEVNTLLAARLASAGFKPDALGKLTPLWLFVLAEAEATQHSQRLGELGSHIVDEFLLGSLHCDLGSVLYASPADLQGWGPTAAIAQNRRYSMPGLIAYLQANAVVGGQPIRLSGR
ncbi:MAG TPA: peroxidase family protein [Stellaceae bacterium]|nr:peroxidase family protein [Stellaceae bacterium]